MHASRQTDGWTDGQTNARTDTNIYIYTYTYTCNELDYIVNKDISVCSMYIEFYMYAVMCVYCPYQTIP